MRENGRMRRRGARGFSLIELLIVVALVGTIAAIAIPGLINAKRAANEAAAVSYLRTWNAAQILYLRKHGYYASSDEELAREGFVGRGLVAGGAEGDGGGYSADDTAYVYVVDTPENPDFWSGRADPRDPTTGRFHYYNDLSGVIRRDSAGPADVNSAPIDQ